MNYVITRFGQTMSNQLAVEQEALVAASPKSDVEWVEWYERTANFWDKWTREGWGDGSGMARHAAAKAQQHREKIAS